jgi:hypothetical protein
MNTAAIVSTFTVLGSLAYAAGQGAALGPQPVGAVTRSPVHEDGAVSQRHQGTTMAALAGGDGSCTIGEPLNWFTTPRPLPACFTIRSMHYKDAEDINRDGEAEFIDYVGGVVLSVAGVAQPGGCVAYITQTNWDGEEVVLTRHCVASSESVATYAAERFPDQTVTTYFDSGLRDIDKDGDLDLVLMLDMQAPPHYPYYVWLENTGYEASNGVAADINRDGVVDGKDLASVLAAWTP